MHFLHSRLLTCTVNKQGESPAHACHHGFGKRAGWRAAQTSLRWDRCSQAAAQNRPLYLGMLGFCLIDSTSPSYKRPQQSAIDCALDMQVKKQLCPSSDQLSSLGTGSRTAHIRFSWHFHYWCFLESLLKVKQTATKQNTKRFTRRYYNLLNFKVKLNFIQINFQKYFANSGIWL